MSLLELEGVHKSRWRGPHRVVVLDGVDLVVDAGELVAVWGSRGTGKTTLAQIAAGLEVPDDGTARFDGGDLTTLSRGALARLLLSEVGWAQRIGPGDEELHMLDYVAVPLLASCGPRQARRGASAALAQVGLRGCGEKRWTELTDGERTLAALAHALVRNPRLLVVDDPTANLDMIDGRAVMGLLRSLAEDGGLGVLVTVPDMSDMLQAHRIASLSEGRLLVPSEPGELFEDGGDVIEFPVRQRSV